MSTITVYDTSEGVTVSVCTDGAAPPMSAISRLRQAVELSPAFPPAYSDIFFDTPAVVAFRFDDSWAEEYSKVFPEMYDSGSSPAFQRAFPGSYATVRGNLDVTNYLTTAQVQEIQRKGGEILAHSRTHLNPTTNGGWTNFLDEVVTATDEMRALGLRCDGFAQPGTWTGRYYFDTAADVDSEEMRAIRSKFVAASSYYVASDQLSSSTGAAPMLALPAVNRYGALHHVTIDQMSTANFQTIVDDAIKNGAGVIFVLHPYRLDTSTYLTLANFRIMLDYVKTKRDAAQVTVMTVIGLLHARRGAPVNLLWDGGFEQQAAGFVRWQTAGTVTSITSPVDTGSRAVQIAADGGSSAIWQDIACNNLRSLALELRIAPNAATYNSCRVFCGITVYNSAGSAISGYSFTAARTNATAAFVTHRVPLVIPVGGARLRVHISSATTAGTYDPLVVDSVVLRRC